MASPSDTFHRYAPPLGRGLPRSEEERYQNGMVDLVMVLSIEVKSTIPYGSLVLFA
jgi:hypothetical protein